MKRILLLALVLMAMLELNAQSTAFQVEDPVFIARYASFDFKGKFAAEIGKESPNTYFLLDFSTLSTRFERVYFMNLSFSFDELISIDPDITKNRVCFMSNEKYQVPEVLKLFEKLKADVRSVSTSWQEEKKVEWLKGNDKYK
jgi:hypothetical protein